MEIVLLNLFLWLLIIGGAITGLVFLFRWAGRKDAEARKRKRDGRGLS